MPLAIVGAIVGFFGTANMRIAGLTLNILTLVPAIILAIIVIGCCGGLLSLPLLEKQSKPATQEKERLPAAPADPFRP